MATTKSKNMMRCDSIEATTATQVRTKLHRDIIEMYQADIEHGAPMPAIDVFAEKGSARHILADGFHRLIATIEAGREEIEVKVHEGGMHEALIHALGANTVHGLRRSNADKIHAVQMALKDPAISQLTQQEIADVCRVSVRTVERVEHRQGVGRYEKPTKSDSKPKKPTAEDHRPTKPEPTQAEIELDEVRQALSALKVLPYDGDTAAKTLGLSKDDVADLEYVSSWCAHAVLAYRNGEAHE